MTLLEVFGQAPEILDVVGDFFDTEETVRFLPSLLAVSHSIYEVLFYSRWYGWYLTVTLPPLRGWTPSS